MGIPLSVARERAARGAQVDAVVGVESRGFRNLIRTTHVSAGNGRYENFLR
jgi:hypothetical protein